MRFLKVAVGIQKAALDELDKPVRNKVSPSRSRAIQEAVQEKLSRMKKTRLAEECAKLDPKVEQAQAEAGLSAERHQWPACWEARSTGRT